MSVDIKGAWGRVTWGTLHRWAATDPPVAEAAQVVEWLSEAYPCERCRLAWRALTAAPTWE